MVKMVKIHGCRDPRYKHKYLDKHENTENLNALTERYESDDKSVKHLEARDRRYSCLILLIVRH